MSEGPYGTGPTQPGPGAPGQVPPGGDPGWWVPPPRPPMEGGAEPWGAGLQPWAGGAQPWPQGPPAGPGHAGGPPFGPPPFPPPRRNRGLIAGIVAAVVLVLAGGGGVAWFLWQRATTPAASTAAVVSASASVAPSAAPEAGVGPIPGGASARTHASATTSMPSGPAAEQAALEQLTALRADSLARLPLDGRWVAQVASKWVGVTDPLQTAANGTHTFYATDILAEHLSAYSTVDDRSKVYLVWGTDFGKRSVGPGGAPIWVTLVDAGYASHDNVLKWCHVTYPSLTPQQLADTCAPRQLAPPA